MPIGEEALKGWRRCDFCEKRFARNLPCERCKIIICTVCKCSGILCMCHEPSSNEEDEEENDAGPMVEFENGMCVSDSEGPARFAS